MDRSFDNSVYFKDFPDMKPPDKVFVVNGLHVKEDVNDVVSNVNFPVLQKKGIFVNQEEHEEKYIPNEIGVKDDKGIYKNAFLPESSEIYFKEELEDFSEYDQDEGGDENYGVRKSERIACKSKKKCIKSVKVPNSIGEGLEEECCTKFESEQNQSGAKRFKVEQILCSDVKMTNPDVLESQRELNSECMDPPVIQDLPNENSWLEIEELMKLNKRYSNSSALKKVRGLSNGGALYKIAVECCGLEEYQELVFNNRYIKVHSKLNEDLKDRITAQYEGYKIIYEKLIQCSRIAQLRIWRTLYDIKHISPKRKTMMWSNMFPTELTEKQMRILDNLKVYFHETAKLRKRKSSLKGNRAMASNSNLNVGAKKQVKQKVKRHKVGKENPKSEKNTLQGSADDTNQMVDDSPDPEQKVKVNQPGSVSCENCSILNKKLMNLKKCQLSTKNRISERDKEIKQLQMCNKKLQRQLTNSLKKNEEKDKVIVALELKISDNFSNCSYDQGEKVSQLKGKINEMSLLETRSFEENNNVDNTSQRVDYSSMAKMDRKSTSFVNKSNKGSTKCTNLSSLDNEDRSTGVVSAKAVCEGIENCQNVSKRRPEKLKLGSSKFFKKDENYLAVTMSANQKFDENNNENIQQINKPFEEKCKTKVIETDSEKQQKSCICGHLRPTKESEVLRSFERKMNSLERELKIFEGIIEAKDRALDREVEEKLILRRLLNENEKKLRSSLAEFSHTLEENVKSYSEQQSTFASQREKLEKRIIELEIYRDDSVLEKQFACQELTNSIKELGEVRLNLKKVNEEYESELRMNKLMQEKLSDSEDNVKILSAEKQTLESRLKEIDKINVELNLNIETLRSKLDEKDVEFMQKGCEFEAEFKDKANVLDCLKSDLDNRELLILNLKIEVEKFQNSLVILKNVLINHETDLPNEEFFFKNEIEGVIEIKKEVESFRTWSLSNFEESEKKKNMLKSLSLKLKSSRRLRSKNTLLISRLKAKISLLSVELVNVQNELNEIRKLPSQIIKTSDRNPFREEFILQNCNESNSVITAATTTTATPLHHDTTSYMSPTSVVQDDATEILNPDFATTNNLQARLFEIDLGLNSINVDIDGTNLEYLKLAYKKLEEKYIKLKEFLLQEFAESSRQSELMMAMYLATNDRYKDQINRMRKFSQK